GYCVLAVLCSAVAWGYVKIFYGARDRVFRKMPVPDLLKPAAGAALLGVLAMAMPSVLGMGYGYVQQAIDGDVGTGFMLLLVGAKIVATSLTISSGGSGGVFGPSLVIGGLLGGAIGTAAHRLAPAIFATPAAFVMVGMGAFFAGAAKVPFASVVM